MRDNTLCCVLKSEFVWSADQKHVYHGDHATKLQDCIQNTNGEIIHDLQRNVQFHLQLC